MKKFLLVIIILVSLFSVFAFDIKAGAGVSYRPVADDLTSAESFKNKDSWNFTAYSQYNWKNFGFILNFTPDYLTEDYTHLTFDVGFNGIAHFGKFEFNYGIALPLTYDDGVIGIDDMEFSAIADLMQYSFRYFDILYGLRAYLNFEYEVIDNLSVGTRFAYVIGKSYAPGSTVLEFLGEAKSFWIDLFVTYQVH